MIATTMLEQLCDRLIALHYLSLEQKKEVLARQRMQERRIFHDRQNEFRRLAGRRKVAYEVSEIELIASFQFNLGPDKSLTEPLLSKVLAEDLGFTFQHLDPLSLDFRLVTETFSGPFAEKHLVLPIKVEDGRLVVAIANPFDRDLIDQLPKVTNRTVQVVICPKSDILKILLEYHGFRKSVTTAAQEQGTGVDLGNLEQYVKMKAVAEIDPTDRPIVQAVWYLFNYAFEQRASDIHIEPRREHAQVRIRIDGILHQVQVIPKMVHPAIISRIKSLARMDIAERRRPQDGRIKTNYKNHEIELRVNTIPTAFGEKAVVRIFDPQILLQDIVGLGFFAKEREQILSFLNHTNGLILVTGPTGSGKTTTLYSSLHYLSSPGVNITTIEDPIEVVYDEFNQIAIQPKIGLTFEEALRMTLRQDPDIIMVGEIRDAETAQMAVQAALTGHLVLSTVHTNDAASAITRLIDLQVMPFLLASVLVGVVAQRLVRTICPQCVTTSFLTPEEVTGLNIPGAEGRKLKSRFGQGCPSCRGTGYRGRTGVFEVMPITRAIQDHIVLKRPSIEIRREAISDGMLTLREYAIMKLAKGLTTYEEVMRLTDER